MALLKNLRTTRADDKAIVSKSKTRKVTQAKIKGNDMQAMIELANQKLDKYRELYDIITDVEELENYFRVSADNGYQAFDTETTGLDFYNMDIAGICIYTKGLRPAYVPINHESYITGARMPDQLTEEQVAGVMRRYKNGIKFIMHNAKFDIRVCIHTLNVRLECYWDTMLAAYCIDEEESHGLKEQHLKYCESMDEEALKIDNLFNGMTFTKLPISTAYLYAAGDAVKTWQLWEYQRDGVFAKSDMSDVFDVFMNIEMKVLPVVIDMEERGVSIDSDFAHELSINYHKQLDEAEKKAQQALSMYDSEIENFRLSNPTLGAKLSNPISITSPTQLAILFYDVLKLQSPDSRNARGTGVDILEHFAKGKHKNLCESILKIRELEKLLGTYIDKMPEIVQEDGRIHCNYNQNGTKTGRFSSNNPNLQNIPSKNHDIRKMFKAQDGFYMMGFDFSQQEPKVTAFLSQDKIMLDTFKQGKDIYAKIASLAFNTTYENCLEFRPDGTTNMEGKNRRTQAKSIVLGILYGRGIPSIGEQLGVSTQKAQEIYDKVLDAFPALAKFDADSKRMARTKGYVTTAWGRRRHLRDMQLPQYEFALKNNGPLDFDPLNWSFEQTEHTFEVPRKIRAEYTKKLDKAFGIQQKQKIKDEALARGIVIKLNGGFISRAERQCVNARVQGSAADLTKTAMISIGTNKRLRELDCHLIMQVHDEVLLECPKENIRECRDIVRDLMTNSSMERMHMTMKSDCEITERWYGTPIELD